MTSLSELSKPVAWEVKGILCHSEEEARVYVGEPERLYSQEYVSALLAERDAFEAYALAMRDEWRARGERIAELEAKLATPVRLPGKTSDLDSWDGGWDACLEECAEAIRAAGYRVEGDE